MSRAMPSLRTDQIYELQSKQSQMAYEDNCSASKGPLIGKTNSENVIYHGSVCTFYRCRKDRGRCDPPFQIHASKAHLVASATVQPHGLAPFFGAGAARSQSLAQQLPGPARR